MWLVWKIFGWYCRFFISYCVILHLFFSKFYLRFLHVYLFNIKLYYLLNYYKMYNHLQFHCSRQLQSYYCDYDLEFPIFNICIIIFSIIIEGIILIDYHIALLWSLRFQQIDRNLIRRYKQDNYIYEGKTNLD